MPNKGSYVGQHLCLFCQLPTLGNARFLLKKDEFRLNKVKSKQVNKFNNLVCKKEGNITKETSQSTRVIASSLQAGRQPPSLGQCGFPGSQCSPPNSTPSMEGISQEGSSSLAGNSLGYVSGVHRYAR